MYTSLDQLNKKDTQKHINRRIECRNLFILLIVVAIGSYSIINYNLIKIYAQDIVSNEKSPVPVVTLQQNKKTQLNKPEEKRNIKDVIEKHSKQKDIPLHAAPHLKDKLAYKRTNYHLPFNTLAPNKKLIINDLKIDVPIVSNFNKSFEQVAKGDFTDELMNGVAIFPGTAKPGTKGKHTILFGHSSQELWAQNEFGNVFAKLHQLEAGAKFSIIREGEKLDYKILAKEIIRPSEIKEVYEKRNNEPGIHYLTLLACYPPGSTLQRVVTIAKQING